MYVDAGDEVVGVESDVTVEEMDDDTGVSGAAEGGDRSLDEAAEQPAGAFDNAAGNVAGVGVGVSKLLARAAAAKEVSAKQLAAAQAHPNLASGLGSTVMVDRAHSRFMQSVGRAPRSRLDEHIAVEEIDDDGGDGGDI